MKSDMHNKQTRKQALEEASEWVIRLDETDLNPAEQRRWQAWMQASPLHAQAFEDICLLWEVAPDLNSQQIQAARNPADALTEAMTEALRDAPARPAHTLGHSARDRTRRRITVWATVAASLVVAAALLLSAGLAGYWQDRSLQTRRYATAIAEQQQVLLPDGSTVELGAASELVVNFTAEARRVDLVRGQAYFSVQHDLAYPFEVRAGAALIRDVGTRFDVNYHRGDAVAVTVAEGRVSMSLQSVASNQQPAAAVDLSAGYQAILIPGQGLSRPRKVNVSQALSWLKGVMTYHGVPLRRVVEDMNRYSSVPIEVGDRALGRLPVTGRWNTHDVSGWLHGLARALSLTVRYTPEKIMLIRQ